MNSSQRSKNSTLVWPQCDRCLLWMLMMTCLWRTFLGSGGNLLFACCSLHLPRLSPPSLFPRYRYHFLLQEYHPPGHPRPPQKNIGMCLTSTRFSIKLLVYVTEGQISPLCPCCLGPPYRACREVRFRTGWAGVSCVPVQAARRLLWSYLRLPAAGISNPWKKTRMLNSRIWLVSEFV